MEEDGRSKATKKATSINELLDKYIQDVDCLVCAKVYPWSSDAWDHCRFCEEPVCKTKRCRGRHERCCDPSRECTTCGKRGEIEHPIRLRCGGCGEHYY